MITVEEATDTLVAVLRTDVYQPRAYWTITPYKPDPLLNQPKSQFSLDPIIHKPKTPVGPAA